MQSDFSSFNLSPAVKQGLADLGFSTPTAIQAQAIPLVLAGKDAILQAKTGSGKTLAFGLPILSMLKPKTKPQALVVVPTRELAIQVRDSLASVSTDSPLKTLAIYGGVGLGPQESALKAGIDVVIGTPGRLKDLIGRGSLDLSRAPMLVLDEADEMLDMGFRRDIDFLLGKMPARKQTLILSATMPEAIMAIARQHLTSPVLVGIGQTEASPSEISHHFVRVTPEERLPALLGLLQAETPDRALVFTRMKHETKRLALKLTRHLGAEVGFLNGNMSQNARNRMLERFRSGELRLMVATDVAARGLDIEGLTHVFHYAVPTVVENYIHRSGRTGRAGNAGKTICLVTPDDADAFKAIRKRVASEEITLELPELSELSEPTPEAPKAPASRRTASHAQAPKAQAPKTPGADAQPGRDSSRESGREPARTSNRSARPAREAAHDEPRSDWKKFKLSLPHLREPSEESLRQWLVQRTGIAPGAIRAITMRHDHAIVEVSARSSDRFLQAVQRPQAMQRPHAPERRAHGRR